MSNSIVWNYEKAPELSPPPSKDTFISVSKLLKESYYDTPKDETTGVLLEDNGVKDQKPVLKEGLTTSGKTQTPPKSAFETAMSSFTGEGPPPPSLMNSLSNPGASKQIMTDMNTLVYIAMTFVQNIENILTNVLYTRDQYDVVEWISSKIGNVVSGNISSADELRNSMQGVGVEITDLFTKTELNALTMENKVFTSEGQAAHDLAYDFIIFPIMVWVVYNWYYKLFYPFATCPTMSDYSKYTEMIYPGIVTGHLVLPVYELNKAMSFVNSYFDVNTKTKYSLIFFSGSFLAVYYLWLRGIAKFETEASQRFSQFLMSINILYLFFWKYLTKYPPMGWASALLALMILILLIFIAINLSKIVYIIFMAFFVYNSFFVLMVEQKSWDIIHLMDKINNDLLFAITEDDRFDGIMSTLKTIFKLANNFVFTSPFLIMYVFIALSHLSYVVALGDSSNMKGFMIVFLILTSICASLYSLIAFSNRYITGFFKLKPTKLSMSMKGIQGDDMEIIQQIANNPLSNVSYIGSILQSFGFPITSFSLDKAGPAFLTFGVLVMVMTVIIIFATKAK